MQIHLHLQESVSGNIFPGSNRMSASVLQVWYCQHLSKKIFGDSQLLFQILVWIWTELLGIQERVLLTQTNRISSSQTPYPQQRHVGINNLVLHSQPTNSGDAYLPPMLPTLWPLSEDWIYKCLYYLWKEKGMALKEQLTKGIVRLERPEPRPRKDL